MLDPQSALVYAMVLTSASDREMSDAELRTIGEIVRYLPAFRGFAADQLTTVARGCAKLVREPDGLGRLLDLIFTSLPEKLRETAYAVACDVVAADGRGTAEELRVLDLLRRRLEIGKLLAAAIERGARARHMRL